MSSSLSQQPERGSFTCGKCGLHLCDTALPVRHVCRGTPRPTAQQRKAAREPEPECEHRGEIVERLECVACGGKKLVPIFACAIHGRCHVVHAEDDQGREGMSCRWCRKRGKGFEPQADL